MRPVTSRAQKKQPAVIKAGTQRIDLLLEAAMALLSSPRLDEVLRQILKFAARTVRADAYAVWRHHAASGTWKAIASEGLSRQYLQHATITDSNSPGLPDRPILASNVTRQPLLKQRQQEYDQEHIKSLMVMPLAVRGEKAGTLTFYFHQKREFSKKELKTV